MATDNKELMEKLHEPLDKGLPYLDKALLHKEIEKWQPTTKN